MAVSPERIKRNKRSYAGYLGSLPEPEPDPDPPEGGDGGGDGGAEGGEE